VASCCGDTLEWNQRAREAAHLNGNIVIGRIWRSEYLKVEFWFKLEQSAKRGSSTNTALRSSAVFEA